MDFIYTNDKVLLYIVENKLQEYRISTIHSKTFSSIRDKEDFKANEHTQNRIENRKQLLRLL